jgi:hypothetical protein
MTGFLKPAEPLPKDPHLFAWGLRRSLLPPRRRQTMAFACHCVSCGHAHVTALQEEK